MIKNNDDDLEDNEIIGKERFECFLGALRRNNFLARTVLIEKENIPSKYHDLLPEAILAHSTKMDVYGATFIFAINNKYSVHCWISFGEENGGYRYVGMARMLETISFPRYVLAKERFFLGLE